jgi:hypothetical protein
MKHILITIAVAFAICGQLLAEDNVNGIRKIEPGYKGAFDTFYKYISTVNKNELSEEKIKKLFTTNFCFLGNPNLVLSTHKEISDFYVSIRNKTYPIICHPHKFIALKLHKLSYLPITENSVKIALLDVFITTPNKTPRKKMSFIYSLVFDKNSDAWLFNSIGELRVKNYPKWTEVRIRDKFKYNLKVPISKLKPLLASEIK